MSAFNSQPSSQNPTTAQSFFPPQYNQPNPNHSYQSANNPPPANYAYPPQQYPPYGQQFPTQQYPPYQQQGYPVQNPYQNPVQRNPPQLSQDYTQTQLPNSTQPNPALLPPPPIPQNSPLLRHGLNSVVAMLKRNPQQFSPEFQQKITQNQRFKSLNRQLVFIPSFLIMGHVILNRNKKWFRLTVNAKLIRRSLLGLLALHFSTNALYVMAYRDLIARNRERIEKVIVREEFMGGAGNQTA